MRRLLPVLAMMLLSACVSTGKSDAPATTVPRAAAAADPLGGFERTSPRQQHYAFAYQAVPQIFFRDPPRFLASLAAPDAEMRLRALMRDVGGRVTEGPTVEADSLRSMPVIIAGRTGQMIIMPRPLAAPEAYAVVLLPAAGEQPARYFSVERTFPAAGLPELGGPPGIGVGVVCEWFPTGTRANYGVMTAPSEIAMQAAVGAALDRKPVATMSRSTTPN